MNEKLSISSFIISSQGKLRTFSIAFLTTMAIVLAIVEHMIPKPLPWMRLGLANAVTLFAFTLMKPGEVLTIVICRVVASSLLMGSFLSITFILSLGGAVSSFLVTYFLFAAARQVFSLVGISIIGALTSNLVQLVIVNALFVNSRVSFYLVPFVLLFALVGGTLSGFFGRFLVENL